METLWRASIASSHFPWRRCTQAVLAIELLVATQAIDWRVGLEWDPNARGDPRGAEQADPQVFATATQAARRPQLAARLGPGAGAAYLAVRSVAEPMCADRVLEPDIRAVRRMIDNGTLLAQVNAALREPLRPILPLARTSS